MRKTIKSVVLALLAVLVIIACTEKGPELARIGGSFYNTLALRRVQGEQPTAYLRHDVAGVLNLATTTTAIGDLRPTGVTKTYAFDYGNDTFADQWVPVVNDTDLMFTPYSDFIIDQVRVCSDFGSGDTLIARLYVGTTASFTLVSGPDTLIGGSKACETIDVTGVAAASRDIDVSATQGWAFHLDEHGTIAGALALFDGREYDVQ